LIVSDDLVVGDDLGVTGLVTIGETLAVTGVVTANAGVVVDNFTLDGTTLALSSGDFTVDVAGDIRLNADGGQIHFEDAGVAYGLVQNSSSSFLIEARVQDKDILFAGNDGGSSITALQLDMSNAGAATFNGRVTADAGIDIDNIIIDGSTITSNTHLNLDIVGDLRIDVDGAEIIFKDGGVQFGEIYKSGNDLRLESNISDGNLVFTGNDGGTGVVALTLDMSEAGTAIFNHDIKLAANAILDCAGNLRLDAESASIFFQTAGSVYGGISESSGDFVFKSDQNDKDILFKGVDGGSTITALTLDMSDAGTAIFNNKIAIGGSPAATDAALTLVALGPAIMFHDSTAGEADAAIFVDAGNISFKNGANGNNVSDLSTRVVLDNSGRLLAGGITSTRSAAGGAKFQVSQANNNWISFIENTIGSGAVFCQKLEFSGSAPNNTSSVFIQATDTGAERWKVFSNGNVVNVNNSYGAISDVKLKENIVDAASQWDDIKALTVRKYSMKADNLDAPNRLGVIAQEVETAGMGGLVFESPDRDRDNNDLGTVTKQVNYSILYMKAVKALQEAMTRIETLETKVAALEG